MRQVNVKQGTDEWHQFRRTHLGASDAISIMGMSPWKSPLGLYEDKIFNIDQEENEFMARGKRLEPIALEAFEKETGLIMFPGVFVHDTIDWMSASFDGITLEQDAICEIKCPGKKDHAIALKGKIPTKYIPQLQHQIYVSGLSFSYYYSFDGESGVVIEVKRDQEFIDKMVEKEFEFWNCLMSLTPPKYEINKNEYATATPI
jgi:putative phage-type endonuclease